MESTKNTVFISESNPNSSEVLRFLTSCYTASLVDSFLAIPAVGPTKRIKNVASLFESLSLLPFQVLSIGHEIFEKSLAATYNASSDIVTGELESLLSPISLNLVTLISGQGWRSVSTHLVSKSSFLDTPNSNGKQLQYRWCVLPIFTPNNPGSVVATCYTIKDGQWLHGITKVRSPSPFAALLLSCPTANLGLQNWPGKLEFVPNEEANGKPMTLGSYWLRQVGPLHKIVLTTVKISDTEVAEYEFSRVGNAMLHATFLAPPPEGEPATGNDGDIYLPVVAPQPVYGSLEQLLQGTEPGWLPIDDVDITGRGDYVVGWTGIF